MNINFNQLFILSSLDNRFIEVRRKYIREYSYNIKFNHINALVPIQILSESRILDFLKENREKYSNNTKIHNIENTSLLFITKNKYSQFVDLYKIRRLASD